MDELEPGPYREPVDLRALMKSEPPQVEWMIPQLVPIHAITSIVARAGDEKSLSVSSMACDRAAGCPVLGTPARPPVHVLYVDQEMGLGDLYERFADFGWTPDHLKFDRLVEHLHYFQLIDLPPLNTEEGGAILESLCVRYAVEWVILDTVSRVISGEENSADTFRRLDAHTGRRLRRRGITVTYLDHLGKDTARGARGSSAKTDAVDNEWAMEKTSSGALVFTRVKSRQGWVPPTVTIQKETEAGRLVYRLAPEKVRVEVLDVANVLDELNVPADATATEAQDALQAAGKGRRRTWIVQAQQHRRSLKNAREPSGNRTLGTKPGTVPEPPGTMTEPRGTADGNSGSPLRRGTEVQADPFTEAITNPLEEATRNVEEGFGEIHEVDQ